MTEPHLDDTDVAFSPVLELKFVSDGDAGTFSGMAAVFGNVDSHRDTIRPGAFAASLAAHKAAGTAPALLWSHDQAKPIGRLTNLAEDDRGLKVEGKFNLGTTNGRDAYAHAKEGDSTGLSIGYQVPAGGATHGKDGTRTLQRVAVHEISMVTLPSNSQARISGVKAMLTSPADIERILRAGGVPNRLAAKIAEVGFPAVSGKSAEPEVPPIDVERIKAVLRQHQAQLKSIASLKPRFYGTR